MSESLILGRLFRSFSRAAVHAAMVMIVASGTVGCSFARLSINDEIGAGDVAFIVPGHTTLRDIIERLGAPDEIQEASEGTVIFYHFLDAKYSRVNFGYLLRPWTPIQPDLVLSTTGFGTDVFEVTFDDKWIARQHAFTHHISGRSYVPWPF
ncbi:MAG: hypothetical protein H0W13_07500 [Nitrospirales bacterium]|nr:hypothetical protein [Nitrospirales bacterium]